MFWKEICTHTLTNLSACPQPLLACAALSHPRYHLKNSEQAITKSSLGIQQELALVPPGSDSDVSSQPSEAPGWCFFPSQVTQVFSDDTEGFIHTKLQSNFGCALIQSDTWGAGEPPSFHRMIWRTCAGQGTGLIVGPSPIPCFNLHVLRVGVERSLPPTAQDTLEGRRQKGRSFIFTVQSVEQPEGIGLM